MDLTRLCLLLLLVFQLANCKMGMRDGAPDPDRGPANGGGKGSGGPADEISDDGGDDSSDEDDGEDSGTVPEVTELGTPGELHDYMRATGHVMDMEEDDEELANTGEAIKSQPGGVPPVATYPWEATPGSPRATMPPFPTTPQHKGNCKAALIDKISQLGNQFVAQVSSAVEETHDKCRKQKPPKHEKCGGLGGGKWNSCTCQAIFTEDGRGNCNFRATKLEMPVWCYVSTEFGDPQTVCPDAEPSDKKPGLFWSRFACITPK